MTQSTFLPLGVSPAASQVAWLRQFHPMCWFFELITRGWQAQPLSRLNPSKNRPSCREWWTKENPGSHQHNFRQSLFKGGWRPLNMIFLFFFMLEAAHIPRNFPELCVHTASGYRGTLVFEWLPDPWHQVELDSKRRSFPCGTCDWLSRGGATCLEECATGLGKAIPAITPSQTEPLETVSQPDLVSSWWDACLSILSYKISMFSYVRIRDPRTPPEPQPAVSDFTPSKCWAFLCKSKL